MSKNSRDESQAQLMGLVTLVLMSAWGGLAVCTLHASMAFNPVALPMTRMLRSDLILPQGWKFFTKDPQVAQMRLLEMRDGSWHSADLGPNAEPSNGFGVSKKPRAQGAEAGLLTYHLPSAAWRECTDAPIDCLDRMQTAYRLESPSPTPTLCGTIGFVVQKPVPWGWTSVKTPFVMPARVAKVEVSC